MNNTIKEDALQIMRAAFDAVLPDAAVRRALSGRQFDYPVTLFAIGKAGWRMARAAYDALGAAQVRQGVVITKYQHSEGSIGNLEIYEAAHPVPDENGVAAARRAMDMAQSLTSADTAILLISGGGSALFECPYAGVTLSDIADITRQLLACGADISEINCLRKRLSAVKGGRFAQLLSPAKLFTIVLSDVLGDPVDVIASGPAHPDQSTCAQAQEIVQKYRLLLSPAAQEALHIETPKALSGIETVIAGNVRLLCEAAAREAQCLGYTAEIMDTALSCEAREAGAMIAAHAVTAQAPCAMIWGGETIVHLHGHGKGGRNQEVALGAAQTLAGQANACVLAAGSDGTDGPTDAAGGLVDGAFFAQAGAQAIAQSLADNNAYPLLKQHDALLITGPTGTNVNDLYMLLKR